MTSRSDEVSAILRLVVAKLVDFLANADLETSQHEKHIPTKTTALVSPETLTPEDLKAKLGTFLRLSETGTGQDGLPDIVDNILRHSVNTTCPGFMDKLYGSPLPPGIAAELILGVLNTNVHVYQVSPLLTLVERCVTKALAVMFGFTGPRAGGINVQGGSASNLTSIVVARNTLFPHTKSHGNVLQNGGNLTLFTSAHGHYSIEKAAQALGLGSRNVVPVPVDAVGRMVPEQLDRLIRKSKAEGNTPFYINATAGSTVLGSFDPFDEIATIAREHRCWLHVDGAWGGSFIFSERADIKDRLRGIEKADSIAINPHKMLGVPVTCSFLLTRDLKMFQDAMTLKAGYLFHDIEEENTTQAQPSNEMKESKDIDSTINDNIFTDLFSQADNISWQEPHDLADLTLQCGRRGDSLKFFMCWQYYGTKGYRVKLENAYDIARDLAQLIDDTPDLTSVLGKGVVPECLQVCFYYTPGGSLVHGIADRSKVHSPVGLTETHEAARKRTGKANTKVTSRICKALISRGFMIDFAPALEGQEERGSFFRVVINISTVRQTTTRLIEQLLKAGSKVVDEMYHSSSPT